MAEQTRNDSSYRFDRFERTHMLDDLRFNRGPEPGARFPDFEAPKVDGGLFRWPEKENLVPLLLSFGSYTCPMTAGSMPVLKELYGRFSDSVRFVTLYVREAHPGESYPQPTTLESKLNNAAAFASREEIPWEVIVDDVAGSLHQRLDTKPNAVYLVDPQGTVSYRALWVGDTRNLAAALEDVSQSRRPLVQQSEKKLQAWLLGTSRVHDIVRSAGPSAQRDSFRAAPPLYAINRLSAMLRPLPAPWRGPLTLAGLVIGFSAAAAWIVRRILRRSAELAGSVVAALSRPSQDDQSL